MPIPQNKDELLAAIRTDYQKLDKDLKRVPDKLAIQELMPGHAKDTLMSPYQLVAYLVGWADTVLEWNKEKEAGREPHFPSKGYKWTELGLLAQKFYCDYPDTNYIQIQQLLQQRLDQIIAIIESKSDAELYQSKWHKDYSMGRMIQLNTSSPYKNARTRVRKFLRENV